MTKLKILVVDDDPVISNLMAEELRDLGHEVITASSGDDAWKIIQQQEIECVISDVRMPNGDGVKLLEKINKMGQSKPVVIMVSGFSDLSKQELIERGADDLIEKPINFKSLIKTIEHQTAQRSKKVN